MRAKGIVMALIVIVILAIGVILFDNLVLKNQNTDFDSKEFSSTEITTESNEDKTTKELTTEVATTESTETTEEVASVSDGNSTAVDWDEYKNNQPEELTKFLYANDCDYEILSDNGCKSLVTVAVSGTSARISMYIVDEDNNWVDADISTDGYVGSNGAAKDIHEGGKTTPMGLFSIGDAFYIEEEPETGLDTFEITENTYWVDDPESEFYNQRVETEDTSAWNSAEHMIGFYDAYYYGFVMNYNMDPVVPGKGSAFFVHVGYGTTAGCVSMSKDSILQYLSRLDKNSNPYILVGN